MLQSLHISWFYIRGNSVRYSFCCNYHNFNWNILLLQAVVQNQTINQQILSTSFQDHIYSSGLGTTTDWKSSKFLSIWGSEVMNEKDWNASNILQDALPGKCLILLYNLDPAYSINVLFTGIDLLYFYYCIFWEGKTKYSQLHLQHRIFIYVILLAGSQVYFYERQTIFHMEVTRQWLTLSYMSAFFSFILVGCGIFHFCDAGELYSACKQSRLHLSTRKY